MTIFTRSTTEVIVSIVDESDKTKVYVPGISVKHTGEVGENHLPTSVVVTKDHVVGPVKAKIKIESKGSRFSSAGNYMVACNIYEQK